MNRNFFLFLVIAGFILALRIEADTTTTAAPAVEATKTLSQGQLEAGEIATKAWLSIVDGGEYGKSWDEMSSVTRHTVKRAEWEKILNKTRRPLGELKSREVVDIRTATNPKNLPAGDYMVMIYKTSYASKPKANELVTLFLQNGEWRVLTYQID